MPDFELHYPHILAAALGTPWAILPEKAGVIAELLAMRAAGHRFTTEEIQARTVDPMAAFREPAPNNGGSVLVIPIIGTIVPRAGGMDTSGAASAEEIGRNFRAAIADPNIAAVVFDIHSPGGSVYGIAELAGEIQAARGTKPIVAVANALAASAAYWIGASAEELVVTASADVGSIGVYQLHQDMSRALDTLGITTTLISAGKYKVEGNPFEILGADARAAMQGRVDQMYSQFVAGVAKGRGVGVAEVRENFGQGRVVGANDAVRLKMADRIGTLNDTVSRLLLPRGRSGAGARVEELAPAAVLEGGPTLALLGENAGDGCVVPAAAVVEPVDLHIEITQPIADAAEIASAIAAAIRLPGDNAPGVMPDVDTNEEDVAAAIAARIGEGL